MWKGLGLVGKFRGGHCGRVEVRIGLEGLSWSRRVDWFHVQMCIHQHLFQASFPVIYVTALRSWIPSLFCSFLIQTTRVANYLLLLFSGGSKFFIVSG